jgi:5-methylcytosine-specific restriction endonuclease McrA
LVCQSERSKAYAERKKLSGGSFSSETKKALLAANPKQCPKCNRAWGDILKHAQHPNTPHHFDHHISPQKGGTNDDSNARILCWQCNLEKSNN